MPPALLQLTQRTAAAAAAAFSSSMACSRNVLRQTPQAREELLTTKSGCASVSARQPVWLVASVLPPLPSTVPQLNSRNECGNSPAFWTKA